jgi:hypothetical protein
MSMRLIYRTPIRVTSRQPATFRQIAQFRLACPMNSSQPVYGARREALMFCRPMVTTLAVSGGHPVTGKLDLDLGAILVAGGRNERDVLHDLRSNRIVIRQAVLDLFYLINLDRSSETQLHDRFGDRRTSIGAAAHRWDRQFMRAN